MPADPIRILRLIARLNIGGPAIQAVTLTADLPPEEFQTFLVCGNLDTGEGDMSYLAAGKQIRPVFIQEFSRNISLLDDFKAFIAIRKILLRFQPHIIHTHTAKAGTLGRLVAILYNCFSPKKDKVILVHTFHGHIFNGYFNRFKTYLFILIERFLARFTDRVIVISRLQKQDICRRYKITSENRVELIPLGFDLSGFNQTGNTGDSVRHKFFAGIPPDIFVVGIVGRLTAIKNHVMLLQTIRYLKEIQSVDPFYFLIVGDGELRQTLEQEAAEIFNSIDNRIVFSGWQKNMTDIYAAMDAVVLTSNSEGTPVTLIEAMAAGKPVIATSVGGVPDLIGKIHNVDSSGVQFAQNGLMVSPGDHQALAHALISLRTDTYDNMAMISNAQNHVLKNYSKSRLAEDIKTLYRRLILNR
ncbi:glycosyltransferase [Thermodesulfobacteriota bacterium]